MKTNDIKKALQTGEIDAGIVASRFVACVTWFALILFRIF